MHFASHVFQLCSNNTLFWQFECGAKMTEEKVFAPPLVPLLINSSLNSLVLKTLNPCCARAIFLSSCFVQCGRKVSHKLEKYLTDSGSYIPFSHFLSWMWKKDWYFPWQQYCSLKSFGLLSQLFSKTNK